MSECEKLAQKKYKTRYDGVSKVIHRELYKKFKFDQTNKWYKHNPESTLKNEMAKILSDFEMQTDHLIPTRSSDWLTLNNRELVE